MVNGEDHNETSKRKLLETDYYQKKLKQSLCDGFEELLHARLDVLTTVQEQMDALQDRISELSDELQDLSTAEMRDELADLQDRLQESQALMDEEISRTEAFQRDNAQMCEEISSDIEEISERIRQVRDGNGDPG